MPAAKSSLRAILPLLARWYATERHRYDFRSDRNPYRTWITEIFMQQTQIAAGKEKLKTFLRRFGDVKTLAAGPENDVLAAFQGMGYYSRARNMFRAAQYIAANFKGKVPVEYDELLKIPGIGHYTAAIVASIHNDERILANDANQARVLSRLLMIGHRTGSKDFAQMARTAAADLFGGELSAGDVNEALMQWGQQICRRTPQCGECFAQKHCLAFGKGEQPDFPVKGERPAALDVLWVMSIYRKGSKYQVFQGTRNFPFLRGELLFPGFISLPGKNKDARLPEKIPPARRNKLAVMAHSLPADFHHAITRYRIAVKMVIANEPIEGGKFFTPAELKIACHSSLMQKALSRLDKLEF